MGKMRAAVYNHRCALTLLGVFLIGFVFVGYNAEWFCFPWSSPTAPPAKNVKEKEMDMLSPVGLLYKQPSSLTGRTDVVTLTPWLAPIVWECTFDRVLLNAIYQKQNLTIATTVFALGKYVRFLRAFLETAEKHYFTGYKVHYYIFTDQPEAIPLISLGPDRRVVPIKVPSSNRWQEITLRRMERLQSIIENQLRGEADYIFSLDVDTKFYGPWGAESLGRLVATLHPGYFEHVSRALFPYERRPGSQAYIPPGEGDYYYGGAVIGGLLEDVYQLTKTCKEQLDIDKANDIEAAWQEESHLNKYFLYNKPSKVLSAEYLWQDFKAKIPLLKVICFSQVIKNYAKVRPNANTQAKARL